MTRIPMLSFMMRWQMMTYQTSLPRIRFGQAIPQEACEKLADVLCKDQDLRQLYLEALTMFGKERFSKNHDEISEEIF
jgi:hypothetical protein